MVYLNISQGEKKTDYTYIYFLFLFKCFKDILGKEKREYQFDVEYVALRLDAILFFVVLIIIIIIFLFCSFYFSCIQFVLLCVNPTNSFGLYLICVNKQQARQTMKIS